jgi:hypothetical protein
VAKSHGKEKLVDCRIVMGEEFGFGIGSYKLIAFARFFDWKDMDRTSKKMFTCPKKSSFCDIIKLGYSKMTKFSIKIGSLF